MNKKNIVYITLLCVCFALDVVALALSFCLNRFFGVLTSSKCAEYEAVVSEIDTSDADMVHIFVVDAKVWDSKAEADQEEEQAAEEPQKGVSCTVLVAMHDVDADKLDTLAAGKDIVFLVEEGELSEGGEVTAVALKVRISQNATEDVNVATLDLHNREKLQKVRHVQIGLLCGVLVFLGAGAFCMIKLCSKRSRW